MSTIENIKERFEQLRIRQKKNGFDALQQRAINDLERMGIPTAKHEEWKYTRIGSLISKDYHFPESEIDSKIVKEKKR